MDSDNFIFYIKTKDIYADIAKRCSNYETDTPLPKATDKRAIPLMKRWIRGNMLEFAALRPKAYSYLIDDEDENK